MSTKSSLCKIAVVGASGRMGRMLLNTAIAHPAAQLVAAIDQPNAPAIGVDAGLLVGSDAAGILVTDQMGAIEAADVVIDFTIPEATTRLAALAGDLRVCHVIGTTGLDAAQTEKVHVAAEKNTIVWAPNYSEGVTLLRHLTHQVAATLDESFDIEVLEMHHKHKIDAPSGTALGLGQAAAAGRGVSLDTHGVFTRHGQTGVRPEGTIGFATLRGGDVVGDHTVMFAAAEERLELSHKAQDRSVFAKGAVRAAIWATLQKPGLYDMTHVLGLNA